MKNLKKLLFLICCCISVQAFSNLVLVKSLANSGPLTLRTACQFANPGDTILIDVKGDILLDESITISASNVTIVGPHAAHSTISASTSWVAGESLFNIDNAFSVHIKNVRFSSLNTGVRAINVFASAGNAGGPITIERCLFEGIDNSGLTGGAILAQGSQVDILRCSFVQNTAFSGGAIHTKSGGQVLIGNCMFYGNLAQDAGGAIYNDGSGEITLIHNTFYENDATGDKGELIYSGLATVVNLANNASAGNGTTDQFFQAGAGAYNTMGGNIILRTGATDNIGFTLDPTDQYDNFVNPGLRTNILTDGFGMKYYTITDPNSTFIDKGNSVSIPTDIRGAPRMLFGGFSNNPDAGACEYTLLRVTDDGGGVSANTLGAALGLSYNGINYVEFDLPAGPHIIGPTSTMVLTSDYIIDGFSQQGSMVPGPAPPATPGVTPGNIEIKLDNIAGIPTAINVAGGNPNGSIIQGLKITGFNNNAIYISQPNTKLYGCEIGFNTSNVAVPNGTIAVYATGAVDIGGGAHWQRNVIAGNGAGNISLTGSNNKVFGNFIGIGPDGMSGIGNSTTSYGIQLSGSDHYIGGKEYLQGNVIGAHSNDGIIVNGASSCFIQQNMIGVGFDGSIGFPNNVGVFIVGNSDNISIGGSLGKRTRNVIADNTSYGVFIRDASFTDVIGNYIGTDSAGTSLVGSCDKGVFIDHPNCNNVNIGGTTPELGNVIAGCQTGIDVTNHAAGSGIYILNNFIGTDKDGSIALSNTDGVVINSGANQVYVGAPLAGNLISGNTQNGVLVMGGSNHFIRSNVIGLNKSGNGTIANETGINLNGASTIQIGGDNLGNEQNTISGNTKNGVHMHNGTSNCMVYGNIIGLDPFGNNPFGNLENGIKIDDAFNISIGGAQAEFRNVISGNDNANATGILLSSNGSGNVIINNYIGTDITGGVGKANSTGIRISEPHQVTIGGSPGFENIISANIDIGIHVLSSQVQLNGNIIGIGVNDETLGMGNGSGVEIQAPKCYIGNLAGSYVNIFSNNVSHGIWLNGDNVDSCTIDNSLIGLDQSGNAAGNNIDGIRITDGDANIIGGSVSNTISGQTNGTGIQIQGTATENEVLNNVIGNFVGTSGYENLAGVIISGGASNNVIGGPIIGSGNDILGNTNQGVMITASNNNIVRSNRIGIDASNNAFPNGTGVVVFNSDGNLIGGEDPNGNGTFNIISFNNADGIVVDNSTNTDIFGNYIGVNVTGNSPAPNGIGIHINNGSTGTSIGDTDYPFHANTISGNNTAGILIDGSNSNNVFQNKIGLTSTSAGALNVQPVGVSLENGATLNQIGGNRFTQGNHISGNSSTGIVINNADGNYIEGNSIGLHPLSNQVYGIVLQGASCHTNNIGAGPFATFGNVISENATSGILLTDGAHDNFVRSNIIGFDTTNVAASSVQLNGVQISNTAGSFNSIGVDQVGGRNFIAGNSNGIFIDGSSDQYVYNNFIGTDSTGMVAIPNFNGVALLNGASNNQIGGSSPMMDNLISGNSNFGIQIDGASSAFNQVLGNTIGLNSNGSNILSNDFGVVITNAANNNHVGMAGAGNGNIISGNGIVGVAVVGANDNLVQNNQIGVNFPNNHGISLQGGSTGNLVGGDDASEGNLISGNDSIGVIIFNANTNFIEGNYIGTDINGTDSIPNILGIYVNAGSNNVIGDSTAGHGNLISANREGGIFFEEASTNYVLNNLIGTDFTGNDTTKMSNYFGIYIKGGSGNIIGTNWNNGAGNVICGNRSEGILLDTTTSNKISGNSIGISKDLDNYLGNVKEGIKLVHSSNFNNIGLTGNGRENKIAANKDGIRIKGCSLNDVSNNFIGNDATGGTSPVSNGTNLQERGVVLDTAATLNVVHNLNVLSGNVKTGIQIIGPGTNFNSVQNNYFGVDVGGVNSYPNDSVNVIIAKGAQSNLLGGDISTEGNVFGGNCVADIVIRNIGTNSNQVRGNLIGVGADSSTTYQTGFGIYITDSSSFNVVGSGVVGEGNYIPQTDSSAIYLGIRSNSNKFYGNRIGLFPGGANGSIGGAGFTLQGADANKIGAADMLPGSDSANVITNAQVGVETTTAPPNNSSYGNVIIGNSIYNNAGLGIDQNGDGMVEPIDTIQWLGNNGDIDIPLILTAWNCGVNGYTNVGVETYTNTLGGYRIEFYTNTSPDGSGYGEGETYLGDWQFNPDTTPDTLSIDLGVTLPVGTSITATITGNLGNTSEFAANFTVQNPPVFNPPTVVDELCYGATDGQIEIDAPGAHYFSVDGGLTWNYSYYGDTLTAMAPGTYTVDAAYLNGCILSHNLTINPGPSLPVDTLVVADTCGLGVGYIEFDTIPTNLFGGSGDYTYSYDSGSTYSGSIGSYNLVTGTYNIVLYDSVLGCYSDTLTIALPEVNDVVDETFWFSDFCPGNTVLPDSVQTTGGYWDFGPDPGDGTTIDSLTGQITNAVTGTTYPVVYTVGQCDESDTVYVTAAQVDDPTFTYPDVCIGSVPTWNVTTPGGNWSLQGGTGAIDTTSGLITGPAGTYNVIYTTNGICPAEDTVTVQLFAQPSAPSIFTTQTQYCQGDSLQEMYTNSSTGLTFSWFDNPSLSNPLSTDTSFTPSSIGFGDNYFYLTSEDGNGCVSQADSVNYTYVDLSGLYAGPDISVCIGSTVQLEAFGGETYLWNASNQIVDDLDIANPDAEILIPEMFIVTITDSNGCSVVDSIYIDLLPTDSCFVETYNAFSPNGDGVNDYWEIDGIEGFTENVVRIYNRWGDLVKSIENYNNSDRVWDGTNRNNKLVPAGTYYYVVEVYGKNQKDGNPVGWVQVVR